MRNKNTNTKPDDSVKNDDSVKADDIVVDKGKVDSPDEQTGDQFDTDVLDSIIEKFEAKLEDLNNWHGNNVHPQVDRDFADALKSLKAFAKKRVE